MGWMLVTLSYIQDRYQHNTLLVSQAGRDLHITDFVIFYKAGCLTRDPLTRGHVYDPQVQLRWQNQFTQPLKSDQVLYNQYPPFVFPLLVPLAFFTASQAYLLWTICSLAVAALALWCLNILAPAPKIRVLAFALAALASLPGFEIITLGDYGFFSLFFLSAFYLFLQKRCYAAAGCALALSSIKPHYAIFLAVPAIAARRWRLLLVAAMVEILLLALAGITIGWDNIFNYVPILMHAEGSSDCTIAGVCGDRQGCVRALFSIFLPPMKALVASMTSMVAAWAAALWIALKTARHKRTVQDLTMALIVCLSLLFSPHTHVYDWIALVFIAWLSLPPAISSHSLAQPYRGIYKAWSLLLIGYPILSWLPYILAGGSPASVQLQVLTLFGLHGAIFIGLVLLLKAQEDAQCTSSI